MRVHTEDTVQSAATVSPEEMDEFYERLLNYRISLSVIQAMHSEGRIADKPYKKVLRVLGKKYGFDKDSIFFESA